MGPAPARFQPLAADIRFQPEPSAEQFGGQYRWRNTMPMGVVATVAAKWAMLGAAVVMAGIANAAEVKVIGSPGTRAGDRAQGDDDLGRR